MGVFGQERGEISAFLYGKKCGGNAEKMRMGVFGQEYGEISDGGMDKVKPVYPPSTSLSGGYNNMIKTLPISVTIWRTGIQ